MQDLFAAVDAALESGSPNDVFDALEREFRASGRYDLLFELRGMRKRHELGLPLIQTEASSSFPDDVRPVYDEAILAAARESGELYLHDGNIPAAYRYLRAVGDTAAITEAIATTEPGDQLQELIEIAFQHGVHPARGLKLILENHGMCRAITAFGMHAVEKDREECLSLLVSAIHAEVVARMKRAIEEQEGAAPATGSLPELMAGRDWLFGDYDYYVDTSHLASVIPYCLEATRTETLRLIGELCEYGQHLSPNFAFRAEPPFDNGYIDYSHYVHAVLGENTDEHLRYWQDKADASEEGTESAQLLVSLLCRLDRYEEAMQAFEKHLTEEEPSYLRCPSAMQLSHAAKRYDRLRETARERGDVLSYAAASLLTRTKIS